MTQRSICLPDLPARSHADRIEKGLPSAEIPKAYAKIDHALDSLIASFTAGAAALCRTPWPDETHRKSAISEGWIHLPAGENLAACVK